MIDGDPMIVSTGFAGQMWDARTGQPRGGPFGGGRFGMMSNVRDLAVTAIDDQPVIVSGGMGLDTWDARTGRRREVSFAGSQNVAAVTVANLGGDPLIATGRLDPLDTSDDLVRLWDARTGQPWREPLAGHQGAVIALDTMDIDGEPVIVSGSEDNTVRLWEARTGRPLGVLPMFSEVTALATAGNSIFVAGGSTIVAVSVAGVGQGTG